MDARFSHDKTACEISNPAIQSSINPCLKSLRYSENAEDAFQLVVAEEGYFQGAFPLGVAQEDLGPETLAQLVFQITDLRITGQSGGGFAGAAASAVLPFGNQPFGL